MSRKQKTLLQTWKQQAEKPPHPNFAEELSTFNHDDVFKVPRPVSSCGVEFSGFDRDAGETWIYPTNYPFREYQFSIVKEALFKNTMVILPTGLGKTFIAAVIMYNIYRWYPRGKVVFMAPTRPLVAQQVDSCFKVTGIPEEHTTQMTGYVSQDIRKQFWQRKRVFFLTPQVMANDLVCNVCPAESIKCLVIDEAHKALGNHAYCQVVKELLLSSSQFRVLALTATPGSDIQAVKHVVENLLISHVELRTEDSPDVVPYTHDRDIEKIVVPLGERLTSLKSSFLDIINIYLKRLVKHKAMTAQNPSSLSKFRIFKLREAFSQHPPSSMDKIAYGLAMADFSLCISLYYAYELLCFHGVRPFYNFLIGIINGDKSIPYARTELRRNHEFEEIMKTLETDYILEKEVNRNTFHKKLIGHPKLEKLEELVLKHFNTFSGELKDTRVMIFSQYRDSVQEITELLSRHQPLVKVKSFIGQATKLGNNSVGYTQKQQLEVLLQFRQGVYNTLVSTCVGEEGLDIGEVDLIINFDSPKSPIRLVQRIGRTGRLRKGQIILLVTEGKEEQMYNDSLYKKKNLNKIISKNFSFASLYQKNPTLIPPDIKPVCVKTHIEIRPQKVIPKKGFKKESDWELTKEELEEFNELFKTEPPIEPLLPKSEFVTLQKSQQQDKKQSCLSLNKWTLWQDAPQKSYMVSHSPRCCILTETMELLRYPDVKRKMFSHRKMATAFNMIQTENRPSTSTSTMMDYKYINSDLKTRINFEEFDQAMAKDHLMHPIPLDDVCLDDSFGDVLMDDVSVPHKNVCPDEPFKSTIMKNASIPIDVICLDEPSKDAVMEDVPILDEVICLDEPFKDAPSEHVSIPDEVVTLDKPPENLVCGTSSTLTPKSNLVTSLFGLSFTDSITTLPKTPKHFLDPPPSVACLSNLRPTDISSVNVDEALSNTSAMTHSIISVLNKKMKAKLKRKSKEPGSVLFDGTATNLDASFKSCKTVNKPFDCFDVHHSEIGLPSLLELNKSISSGHDKSEVAIEFNIDFDFPATFPGSSQVPEEKSKDQSNDIHLENLQSEMFDLTADDLNFTLLEDNSQVKTYLGLSVDKPISNMGEQFSPSKISDFAKSNEIQDLKSTKEFTHKIPAPDYNSIFDSLLNERANMPSLQTTDISPQIPLIFDESSNDNSTDDIFEQLCFTNKNVSQSLEASFTLPLKVKDIVSDKTPITRRPTLCEVPTQSTKEVNFPVKGKVISKNQSIFQNDLSGLKYAPSPLLPPKRIMELAEEVGFKKVDIIESDKASSIRKAKLYKAGESKPEALIESIRKRIAEERKGGRIEIGKKPIFQKEETPEASGVSLTSQKAVQFLNSVSDYENKVAAKMGLFQTAQMLLKKSENKSEQNLVCSEDKLDLGADSKSSLLSTNEEHESKISGLGISGTKSKKDSNRKKELIELSKDVTSVLQEKSISVENFELNKKASDIRQTSSNRPLEIKKHGAITHQLDSSLNKKIETNKKMASSDQSETPSEINENISRVYQLDSCLKNKTKQNNHIINETREPHSDFKHKKELQNTSKSKIQHVDFDVSKTELTNIETVKSDTTIDTNLKEQYTLTQILSLIDSNEQQQKQHNLNQSSEDEVVCPTPTKWSRRKLSKFRYRSSDNVMPRISNFSIFGKINGSESGASSECSNIDGEKKNAQDGMFRVEDIAKIASPQKLVFDVSFGFPSSAEAIANFFADESFREFDQSSKTVTSSKAETTPEQASETNIEVEDHVTVTVSNDHNDVVEVSRDHLEPINSFGTSKVITSVISCLPEKKSANKHNTENPFLFKEPGYRNVELDSMSSKAFEKEQNKKNSLLKEKETFANQHDYDKGSNPLFSKEKSGGNAESNHFLLNKISVREQNGRNAVPNQYLCKDESLVKSKQNILSRKSLFIENRPINAKVNPHTFKEASLDDFKVKSAQVNPHLLNEQFLQKQSTKNTQKFPDLANEPVKEQNMQLTHYQLGMKNQYTENVQVNLSPLEEASLKDAQLRSSISKDATTDDVSNSWIKLTGKENKKGLMSVSGLNTKTNKLKRSYLPPDDDDDEDFKIKKKPKKFDSSGMNEKISSLICETKKGSNHKKKNAFLLSQAEVSGSESRDESEGEDIDNFEQSFIDDVNVTVSNTEQHVFYLESIKSNIGYQQKFKLKYSKDENKNVFSQPVEEDCSYMLDSFCVGDDDMESPVREKSLKRNKNLKIAGKRRRITVESSSDEESNGRKSSTRKVNNDSDFITIASPNSRSSVHRHKGSHKVSRKRNPIITSSSESESSAEDTDNNISHGLSTKQRDATDIKMDDQNHSRYRNDLIFVNNNQDRTSAASKGEAASAKWILTGNKVVRDNTSVAKPSIKNTASVVNSTSKAKQEVTSLSWVINENKVLRDNTAAVAKASIKNIDSVVDNTKTEEIKSFMQEVSSLSWVLDENKTTKDNTTSLAKAGVKNISPAGSGTNVSTVNGKEVPSVSWVFNENKVSSDDTSYAKAGAKQEVASLSWVLNENKPNRVDSKSMASSSDKVEAPQSSSLIGGSKPVRANSVTGMKNNTFPVNHVDRGVVQLKKDANAPTWVRSGIKAIRTDNTAALAKADSVSFDISWTLDEEKSDHENIPAPSSAHTVASSYTLPSKPLVILVDSRQLASAKAVISCLRKTHKANPVVMSLGGIDYIVSNRIAAARVLDSEFKSAYTPQKIIDKIRDMCQSYERSYVIIETDTRKQMNLGFNKGGCKYSEFASSILLQTGTHVLSSESPEETSQLLYSLAEKEKKGNFHISVPVHTINANQDLFNFYASLPHVNIACAMNLLYRYPSLNMFLKSSVEELKRVGFLAHHKAEAIWHYVKTDTSIMS